MAIGALRQRLLVDDDWLVRNQARLRVTFVTCNSLMPSLQRKMRSRIVVEQGRNPALRTVAIRTGSLARFRKLPCMHVLVAIFANLRCSLELHLRGSHGNLVTRAAFHDSMRTQQRKLGFRVIESADIRPRSYVVARFTA